MLASGEGRLSLWCCSVILVGNDDNGWANAFIDFDVKLNRRWRSSYVKFCSSSWSSTIPGLLLSIFVSKLWENNSLAVSNGCSDVVSSNDGSVTVLEVVCCAWSGGWDGGGGTDVDEDCEGVW